MDNKRFRCFNLVIYEDDKNFDKQFFQIQQTKSAIWIRHDKDINEESGELKKPHYHVVLKLKNGTTISALSKRLEVGENLIEPVKKSLNGCLKYLIHFKSDDKYEYDITEVKSNDDDLMQKFLDLVKKDMSEEQKVLGIEEFILNFEKGQYIEWYILGRYVRKINCWDAFRRNAWYFGKLVDSHNCKVSAIRYHMPQDEYYD